MNQGVWSQWQWCRRLLARLSSLGLGMVAAIAVLLFAGCSGNSEDQLNPSRLETAFKSAEAAPKALVDKAVGAIKSKDYQAATASLNQLLKEQKLEGEQLGAVKAALYQMSILPAATNQGNVVP